MSAARTVSAERARASAEAPLQRGLAFYRGKTIEFNSAKPGGSGYSWAALMTPYMAAYLHATINLSPTISNEIQGEDEEASSTPNGLTLGLLNPAADVIDIVTHTPGLTFVPERQQVIGAPGAIDTDTFIVSRSSPYQSWKSLMAATTPIPELGLTAGYSTALELLGNAAFGIHVKFINAYNGEAALVQGFQRGDGDLALSPLVAAGPLIAGGVAKPVAVTYPAPKGSSYGATVAGVPTIASLARRFPPKDHVERAAEQAFYYLSQVGSLALFVPTQTPTDRVVALRAAFRWAMGRPSLVAQALNEALTPGYRSGPSIDASEQKLMVLARSLSGLFAQFG